MDPSVVAKDLESFSTGIPEGRGKSVTPTGNTILKFGKSIPIVELFEGLIVIGTIVFFNALSLYFLLNTWSDMLNSDPVAATKAADIASQAAKLQSVWIAIGLILLFVGFVFYFLHRSSVNAE